MVLSTPNTLTSSEISTINELACLGFGHEDTQSMLSDTLAHIQEAEYIQRGYEDEQVVAFAMYKRCLWR